ncbi:ATP-binding protein, partial [Klebsiella pneumoniae]|nr:ATP-binding protein [Klebsiella pneumoniae]
ELAGTGLLQTLQIFAYIVYFKPKLLLLDEPDSHLHPDNQYILTDSLSLISENNKSETQVILSTHSKHIIDSLYGEANFIWMKDGNVQNQGMDLDKISMFLDLGALNDLDRVTEGVV